MKISEKIDVIKSRACYKAIEISDKAKDIGADALEFVEDHGPAIMYSILIGGLAVILTQDVKYMRMLNAEAKKGNFLWFPGKGDMR